MNELIFEEWISQGRFQGIQYDYEICLFFLKYFDKHSLRLHNIENSDLIFTNDAQFVTIPIRDINGYVSNMKKGLSFPWEKFES